MEYKLPPRPTPDVCVRNDFTGEDVYSHSDEQMQAYAIEAIEAQASVVQHEPFGCVTVVRKLGHADTYHFYPHPQSPYLDNASECHTLYTHPAQQANPQPLSDEQIENWWANDSVLEDCNMGKIDDFTKVVRAIESAHGIQGS